MALSEFYIPFNSLNSYYVDKDTGLPLSNGTLEFYRDADRNTAKTVYQLTTSGGDYEYTSLPNPVTLSSVGTVQNAAGDNVLAYFYPYTTNPASGELDLDLYYVVCKDEDGNIQWTREALPNLAAGNDPAQDGQANSNELSNPQFTEYFLPNAATTLTVSSSNQVFPIAPDWDLVASGTGTITVQRVPVNGNEQIDTSPAYYLSITPSANVTSPYLRQRLKLNSGLWSGKYLSGFVVAQSGVGSNALSMRYQDSSGDLNDVKIFDASLGASWKRYGGSAKLNDSTNSQSGLNAHVDIVIELPPAARCDITSIQVISTQAQLIGDIQPYDARSANRELALMGDYYIPNLQAKRVPSLLVGWDFPVNPTQFGSSGSVSTNTASYIWDQTIAKTSSTATLTYSKNSATGGLQLNHGVADQSYALIQYLSGDDAAQFLNTPLSVNISGYTRNGGNNAGTTAVQVKLFANANASQFGTLPTTIVDLAANGAATLTATAVSNGWYEITRQNLPTATGSLTPLADLADINERQDIGLTGWQIEDTTQVTNSVQGIAVVVSFVPQASSTDYNTIVNSIAVLPSALPCRPAPESTEQVRKKCQWFYETSYNPGVTIPTATQVGAVVVQAHLELTGSNVYNTFARGFSFPFKTEKRVNPSLTFYPVQGTLTASQATVYSLNGNSTIAANFSGSNPVNVSQGVYALRGVSQNRSKISYASAASSAINTFVTNATPVVDGYESIVTFHYVADARIAI